MVKENDHTVDDLSCKIQLRTL